MRITTIKKLLKCTHVKQKFTFIRADNTISVRILINTAVKKRLILHFFIHHDHGLFISKILDIHSWIYILHTQFDIQFRQTISTYYDRQLNKHFLTNQRKHFKGLQYTKHTMI